MIAIFLSEAIRWTARRPRHASWLHLVNVAANLCLAVENVHHVDAVIGDFQERNILVNDTTRVTLVDCDSMQFTDAAGHQFLCAVLGAFVIAVAAAIIDPKSTADPAASPPRSLASRTTGPQP